MWKLYNQFVITWYGKNPMNPGCAIDCMYSEQYYCSCMNVPIIAIKVLFATFLLPTPTLFMIKIEWEVRSFQRDDWKNVKNHLFHITPFWSKYRYNLMLYSMGNFVPGQKRTSWLACFLQQYSIFSMVVGDDVSCCYLALFSLGIALICYFFHLLLLQFIFDFVRRR